MEMEGWWVLQKNVSIMLEHSQAYGNGAMYFSRQTGKASMKKKINKKIINVLLGFWLSSHLIPGKGTAWAGCSRCPRALRVFPTAASLPPEAGESTWAVRNTSQSVQMRMSNVRRLVTRCERSHSTDTWGEEQNLQPAATFLGTYCCHWPLLCQGGILPRCRLLIFSIFVWNWRPWVQNSLTRSLAPLTVRRNMGWL